MSVKKKKIRYRLKTSVKRFLIFFIFFLAVGIYAIKESLKIIDEFKYRETYEYKLTENGYSLDEANILIKTFEDKKLDELLNQEYNAIIPKIIVQKYFIIDNYEKYLDYQKTHEEETYENIIAIVNVHASNGWYSEKYDSNPKDDYLVLVNKFYGLSEDYQREDLEPVNLAYAYANNKASSTVINNFENMRDDLKNALNVRLMVNGSYRSYKNQESIYNDYKSVSLKYADQNVSRPGHSEHQTGLALDLTTLEHPLYNDFIESEEYKWLTDNCYKYGFIIRYPEDKKDITGYSNEEWHFRYVGKDVASKIHNEKITFDEFYAYYIEANKK